MKTKQALWFLIGVLMITSDFKLDGLDLLGYFLIVYILIKHYFGINILKVFIKSFSI